MKRRKYTMKGDALMMGTLQIEEPAPVFSDYNFVVYIKTGLSGFFADLETTKDIIAQLAAIVAERERWKPTLQASITGDDFRV